MVTDYLGGDSSLLLTVTTFVRAFVMLLAISIGLGITLETVSQMSAGVWLLLLFIIQLYFLVRGAFTIPVSTMLLLFGLNLSLLLALVWFAVPHIQQINLWRMTIPFVNGEPFDASLLQVIFGMVLMLYLGHVYLLQCAKVVLPRDPSSRALIRGSVAGTGSVIALLILWVWALNGAIAQEDLINEAGTVITPLAQLLGPFVRVLGSIFIISFVGVAILKATNVLFNLVHERLPTQLRSTVLLPRRRGSLMLRRRGVLRDDLGLRLTYVGLTSGQPQLRLDVHINNSTQYVDFTVREHWDIAAVLDRVPALQPLRIGLTVDVLEAQPEQVRLRIASSLSLTYEGEWDTVGLRLVDALVLPDEYRHLINWMMRQTRVTLASVMDYTGQEENRARNLMAELVDQGFIQVIHDDGTPHYGVRMAPRRGRQLSQSIWQSLSTLDASTGPLSQTDSPAQSMGTPAVAQRVKALLLSERGRFWIGMSPVVLNFLLAEWLLLSGAASFARALSFAGVIGNSLTAGIFPILLLLASRRKGDFVPGVIFLSPPNKPAKITG
ncbi:hypothetical protein C2W62_23325 [Candidatus Entotheonella serta]|nr:hypothetical protein C2W62_23325 [Candidatus Entotheonella serta]